jgi:hypothetical protein
MTHIIGLSRHGPNDACDVCQVRVRVRSEDAFFPLQSATILIHDLGSHWRIREPFGLRVGVS